MNSPTNEVLKPILLRSTTPASSEKVLKYLEGMNRDSADAVPPRSVFGDDPYPPATPKSDRKGLEPSPFTTPKVFSPSPKGGRMARQLEDLANSDGRSKNGKEMVNGGDLEEDADDVGSNVQDGQRSELGEMLPAREPGPDDPPGPRYESFDSGPSFGNMGPLPSDWQSYRPTQYGQAHPPVPLALQPSLNGVGAGLLHPHAALPESVVSPKMSSTKIIIESPSSPSKTRGHGSDREERVGNSPTSPKPTSRAGTSKAGNADRPLSPLSAKSRGTGKTPGTTYPPLPSSDTYLASPRSKAHSKVPSISPSDSPSQIKPQKSISRSPPLSPLKSVHTPSERDDGAELSRNNSRQAPLSPPARSQGLGSVLSGHNNHQTRHFSPYRHAPTQEDLLHAVIRGRAVVLPEVNGNGGDPSVQANGKQPTVASQSKANTALSTIKPATAHSRVPTKHDRDATPTPSRPHSPELNQEEERIVRDTLSRTPRTSYYAGSTLEPDVVNSRFHDMDLCILLQQENDPSVHEVVKRALRKAIHQRMKKLGMKHDRDSIKQFRKSLHDHDPSVHLQPGYTPSVSEDPPEWVKEILDGMARMQQRIDGLVPKIDDLRGSRSFGADGSRYNTGRTFHSSEVDQYGQSPVTQTVNIHTQPTGTVAESMFQQPATEVVVEINEDAGDDDREFDDETHDHNHGFSKHGHQTDGETRTHGPMSDFEADGRDDSPGQQYLEEELYKLRQKPHGSQSALSHRTWEVARDDDQDDYDDDEEEEHPRHPGESGLPTIPDSNGGGYTDHRPNSPPLPPLPQEGSREVVATPPQHLWHPGDYSNESPPLPPWQRIHQRLLSWAIIWPMSELDTALNSTTRGHQVDEVALSIWSTQTYKRYVRARMTDSPQGVVDRLFVPPNMADAISNAVFNGRHGDACGMLRDLWSPFGLEGMPRLLVVLAKHRSDENHWVVHRFSLPDGALTTYDSFPERTLPDGRPLGWWFAIRVAWPNAMYPSPDHLMQKMVRLHRPMQLGIDNSVAAAGIWRNILMGSRAERSLDLERLRDLINTEVRNLRQRKQMGKLSIGSPRPTWEDMN